ncbi:MAG TPA: TylF/MycF/NovP-related O-methyltransferase [Casimicrobiaceae bacterium]|nr:TylF/MycF/NovP-related O-methyltransferase [Casimicrobiaceae bacterium]
MTAGATNTGGNYLPDVPWVAEGSRKGRAPRDGYVRGWGMQFRGLKDSVRADPLYQAACVAAGGRSVMAEDNRINLYLILRFFLTRIPFGHVVEFGSYRAGNALFMARVLQEVRPEAKVIALDTFAGMPQTDSSVDAHNEGDFANVDVDEIRAVVAASGLSNIDLVQGRFEETASLALARAGPIALAHIDSDIYSAIAFAYDAVKRHMVKGGYVIFDDATVASCLGATEAVEELVIRRDWLHAEQISPHFVFRIRLGRDDE